MTRETPAKHIVILVHGIRTFGAWQERLAQLLAEDQPETEVLVWKYGYFDLVAFVIPFFRIPVIRRFRNFLAGRRDEWRGARVDIVAHSFGTYIVARALRGLSPDTAPCIDTVLFCGSVEKQLFPWERLVGKERLVRRVENHCGTNDWWPLIAQLLVFGMGISGRRGFAGVTGSDAGIVNRYYPVDHSGFFTDEFMGQNWVNLLSGGEPGGGEELVPPKSGLPPALEYYADPIKLLVILTPLVLVYLWWSENQQQLAEARSFQAIAEANEILTTDPQSALVRAAIVRAGGVMQATAGAAEAAMAAALRLIERRTAIQQKKNWGSSWLGLVAPSWFEGALAPSRSPDGRSMLITTERGASGNRPPGDALLVDVETLQTTMLDVGPAWGKRWASGKIVFRVKAEALGWRVPYSVPKSGPFSGFRFFEIVEGDPEDVTVDLEKFGSTLRLPRGSTVTLPYGKDGIAFMDRDQALAAFEFVEGHQPFGVLTGLTTRKEKRRLEYVGFSASGNRIYLSRQFNIESYTREGVFIREFPTGGGCTETPVTVVESVLDERLVVYSYTGGGIASLDPISGGCDRFSRGVMTRFLLSPSGRLGIMILRDAPAGVWNVGMGSNWEAITELPGEPLLAAGFQSDDEGESLATLAKDGTLALWRIEGTKPVPSRTLGHAGRAIRFAAFSDDKRYLVVVDKEDGVWVWDLRMGCVLWSSGENGSRCP